ncbi:hypothetical protein [Clostridium saccharoperbutylacetonicum]|uniref:hypothetical protein n=1 Tax=Clostridium saccharoperbutylacetonicum TaxID=36745 RepID=UPI000983E2F3|nr:hypothetical protein [Clostridium saccharoperbutylacetonicum]AQR96387.1 hypothetical protein CLSAP_37110 [Clostridium saccharoperbutylacetonicum]NSB32260.1 hypothetical protein [Clostridium saccharoperbutylacetonicum]
MNLEEKYKDIIEVYAKSSKKDDGFESDSYIHKKSKFKGDFEYDYLNKDNKKRNKKDRNKRCI